MLIASQNAAKCDIGAFQQVCAAAVMKLNTVDPLVGTTENDALSGGLAFV